MTFALLALSLLATEPATHTLVVRHGKEVARFDIVIETDAGPLGEVEATLLAGRTPSADGSDALDRLLDRGYLLRVELPQAHPHAGRVSAALFAALDRNGDGALDADELRTAEARLLARFDADDDGCLVVLEIVPDLLAALPEVKLTGKVSVAVFRPGEALPDDVNGLPARRVKLRVGAVAEERVPAAGVAVEFASAPRWHGANPDVPRSLTKPGRETDRARFEAVAKAVVTLTVRAEPVGWFERLDADGDGQLSTRELRAAPRVLAGLRLPAGPGVAVTLTPGATARPAVPLTRRAAPPRGPVWFQALDRNADGDVSRAEFTGTDDDFRRYDADGDGLISAAEATAADTKRPEGAKR